MRPKDLFTLLLLAAIWGSSYLFLRKVTPAIGVSLTLAYRIILAAVVMVTVFTFTKKLPDYKQFWKQYIVLGIFNLLLPFGFITYSVAHLNASLGAILNATTPLFTMVLSSLWLKEQLNLKKIMALILGLAGLVVLLGWMPLAMTDQVLLSVMFSLLAALSYGVGAIYTRKYVKARDPLKTATGMISAAALLVLPFAGRAEAGAWQDLTLTASVVVLGILCTAFGYALYFRLIARVGAGNASLVSLLVPVFSLLWGLLFLNEPVTPAVVTGLLMILGSMRLILAPAR